MNFKNYLFAAGSLLMSLSALAQAVVFADRREVVVAPSVGPAAGQHRLKLVEHDRPAGMGALLAPSEAGVTQAGFT